ncbi:hypothetical protein GCM10010306_091210 [Streptomyces umbrinus]|uniref:hypothetical protein n=1 Tax=Streptomyces umbrinus TaxID=67370 RepID=UPI0016745C73|nr:hypothetical protein [Streptomyces umbrinus]GHB82381.1 hypothetical protein GCM10010306_091210 [Streptomyces umbrinus]
MLAEWGSPEGTRTRGLKDKRHLYVFGHRPEHLEGPLRLGGHGELTWDKNSMGAGDLTKPWGPQQEPVTFGVRGKRRAGHAGGDGQLAARFRHGSVLRYQRPNAGSAVQHSNEKPWPMLAEIIESSTVRAERVADSDLVVDPCPSSGSTGVATILTGRRIFLVELTRAHADLCVQRIQTAERIVTLMVAA